MQVESRLGDEWDYHQILYEGARLIAERRWPSRQPCGSGTVDKTCFNGWGSQWDVSVRGGSESETRLLTGGRLSAPPLRENFREGGVLSTRGFIPSMLARSVP